MRNILGILLKGYSSKRLTLMKALDKQIEAIASRVGKDRSVSTLHKYVVVRKHVANYLNDCLSRKDLLLTELDESFLRGFCNYLRDNAEVSQSSVWVYQMPIRTIATAAFNDGIIKKNPFIGFHVSPNVKKRSFLSENEVRRLIDYQSPPGSHLGFVRDMFVFCCFTGLSFIDLKYLRAEDIAEVNGSLWIISKRQKTKVSYQAKLLPTALAILKKHGCLENGKTVFDISSYCTVNHRLKKVGRLCGVSDNLTFHMARHTFATYALSKGMPMESLQSILGHTDLHTTQIYAKITSQKLDKDYASLSEVSNIG